MSGLNKKLKIVSLGILTIAGGAGLIWIANLPYPMIRRPVASVAPIVLLPSYIAMDNNYKNAIANVEQADQLVNNSTSRADIELGNEKVKLAQNHLNQLPVWFLGYEPQFYCSFFTCSWKFTFDEFERARKQIGRMEAVVFQEINALNELEKAQKSIDSAKESYQNAKNDADKQKSVNNWQSSIDKLIELPSNTLAKRISDSKLLAYQRDFQEVSGIIAGGERTNIRISAAQEFATSASKLCNKPPHSAIIWEQCENLWQQSIDHLKSIPLEDTGYLEAQKLLANYTTNLATIQIRKQVETESAQYFTEAERRIEKLLEVDNTESKLVASQLQGIINQLEKVQSGTTSYNQSQKLLKSANDKLQQFQ
ncbi:hypothetical protein [Geminocystis sp. NIES-3709]|uniref:hypothetical protein n=1 Tax=Geminocystis sp. NIES-3709 TaxID=1617448 RepID=UPI0005FCB408|nr:hypothetical protein [Geminocystis sp. NIES-3709]BAQ66550.1 hypothetical protein GM3709_3315 [Geminocystis sp. NIES-3709]